MSCCSSNIMILSRESKLLYVNYRERDYWSEGNTADTFSLVFTTALFSCSSPCYSLILTTATNPTKRYVDAESGHQLQINSLHRFFCSCACCCCCCLWSYCCCAEQVWVLQPQVSSWSCLCQIVHLPISWCDASIKPLQRHVEMRISSQALKLYRLKLQPTDRLSEWQRWSVKLLCSTYSNWRPWHQTHCSGVACLRLQPSPGGRQLARSARIHLITPTMIFKSAWVFIKMKLWDNSPWADVYKSLAISLVSSTASLTTMPTELVT